MKPTLIILTLIASLFLAHDAMTEKVNYFSKAKSFVTSVFSKATPKKEDNIKSLSKVSHLFFPTSFTIKDIKNFDRNKKTTRGNHSFTVDEDYEKTKPTKSLFSKINSKEENEKISINTRLNNIRFTGKTEIDPKTNTLIGIYVYKTSFIAGSRSKTFKVRLKMNRWQVISKIKKGFGLSLKDIKKHASPNLRKLMFKNFSKKSST